MDNENCRYELFALIANLNLQQKICTKAYHIICSLYRSTHVEFNKIRFTIFGFFCDLLWFFKDSAEINKKEKKTKPPPKPSWGVVWLVLESSEG